MDNINNAAIHFSIAGIAITLFQIVIIVACIFIVTKYRKSVGPKLLLVGSLLCLMATLANSILPLFNSFQDSDMDFLKFQVMVTYFNMFAFLVFTLGFFIFAINDLKKSE
ncbi:hypothetical protein [Winogradskyella sp. 3972H.M.0a.05]|uniref:hypothetical protein n=1 Tax=Winogradskyella sp. 3972H.M.0a.05 TaxID=2950277 RepID=UPI003397D6AC